MKLVWPREVSPKQGSDVRAYVRLADGTTLHLSRAATDPAFCRQVLQDAVDTRSPAGVFLNKNNRIFAADYADSDVVREIRPGRDQLDVFFYGFEGAFYISPEAEEQVKRLKKSRETGVPVFYIADPEPWQQDIHESWALSGSEENKEETGP